jgi:nucleotide-binding universal stress UspA family protein
MESQAARPAAGRDEPAYGRIVVPLDGSPLAERVLPHAMALAARFGSLIVLLQATTPPETLMASGAPGAPEGGLLVDPTPIMEGEQRAAEDYLKGLVERLERAGHAATYEHHAGAAAEVIVETARGRAADLIAMTTHGRGGLGRLVLGSVADAVVRGAPCPVLLVRIHE